MLVALVRQDTAFRQSRGIHPSLALSGAYRLETIASRVRPNAVAIRTVTYEYHKAIRTVTTKLFVRSRTDITELFVR